MPSDIKMPQLGMNQDSATILAWLKAVGDKVAVGDPLFEVETDKASMEVEASSAGFVAAILAPEGENVPVGATIAVLADSEDALANYAPAPNQAEQNLEAPQAKENEAKPPTSTSASASTSASPPQPSPDKSDKVLASPLAKRLASERGIDLTQLRSKGAPIHAADLKNASSASSASGGASSASGALSQLNARPDGTAMSALLNRAQDADRALVFATFVAGAWRAVFDEETPISIIALDGSTRLYNGESAHQNPLSLLDLCDTRLHAYAPAPQGLTLAIARDGAGYNLTLSFEEATIPLHLAIKLLDEIAARVEDPIRQLV